MIDMGITMGIFTGPYPSHHGYGNGNSHLNGYGYYGYGYGYGNIYGNIYIYQSYNLFGSSLRQSVGSAKVPEDEEEFQKSTKAQTLSESSTITLKVPFFCFIRLDIALLAHFCMFYFYSAVQIA